MLKQIRHKQFTTMMKEMQSLCCPSCYVKAGRNIVQAGKESDNDHQRPDYNHT